ncbi:HNH endonuclease signature motif containing protein, partial [Actinomycetospora aeridis]
AGLTRAAQRLLAHLDPDGAAPTPDEDGPDTVQLLRHRNGTLDLRARLSDVIAATMIDDGFEVMSRPAGPDDHRDVAVRRAEALKELFAHAFGPGGLITDTRHEPRPDQPATPEPAGWTHNEPTDEPTEPTEPVDGRDGLIPAPRRPEPEQPARAASTAGTAAGAGRALIAVTIDHDWLRRAVGHGVLDDQQLVDAATLRRLACDADVIPLILGSRSEPLDIGRRSRTVPDAIRRALTVRDQGCAFPGCPRRPRRCHAHHIRFWGHGGPTE